jgi:hypothetical protein
MMFGCSTSRDERLLLFSRASPQRSKQRAMTFVRDEPVAGLIRQSALVNHQETPLFSSRVLTCNFCQSVLASAPHIGPFTNEQTPEASHSTSPNTPHRA